MTPKLNLHSTAELVNLYKTIKLYFFVEILVSLLFSWTVYMILSELKLNAYLCIGVAALISLFVIVSSFLRRRKKVEKTVKKETSLIKFSK